MLPLLRLSQISRIPILRFFSEEVSEIPPWKLASNPEPEYDSKTQMLVNIMTPDRVIVSNLVCDQVHLPAESGDMVVGAEHENLAIQLKPGVVNFTPAGKTEPSENWFVGGGFAGVLDESRVNVALVEAVQIQDLDIAKARDGLSEWTSKFDNAKNDQSKAKAEIAVDTYRSMVYALERFA